MGLPAHYKGELVKANSPFIMCIKIEQMYQNDTAKDCITIEHSMWLDGIFRLSKNRSAGYSAIPFITISGGI